MRFNKPKHSNFLKEADKRFSMTIGIEAYTGKLLINDIGSFLPRLIMMSSNSVDILGMHRVSDLETALTMDKTFQMFPEMIPEFMQIYYQEHSGVGHYRNWFITHILPKLLKLIELLNREYFGAFRLVETKRYDKKHQDLI